MDKFFDEITNYVKSRPALIGVFIALVGLFLLLGSIFNWNWIFGDVSPATYSLRKIDGLINLFGRKTARVIFGAISSVIILLGVLIIWLSLK